MRVGLACGNEPRCADFRRAVVPQRSLRAARVGYLVPRADFAATVHSVYRSACNLLQGDALLTVGTLALPDGPSTVRLHDAGPIDLRDWFRVGDVVTVDVRRAETWAPPPSSLRAPMHSDLAPRLQRARMRLSQQRAQCASVLNREGAAVCTQLGHACRTLDVRAAGERIERLIGWGEGLTPAGDDFIVGLLAALHMLAHDDARHAFVQQLGATVVAAATRTTPLAAHALRLAAHGHFNADVHAARTALLSADDATCLKRSLQDLLSRGATSGADLLDGLLAGIGAWAAP